MNIDPLTVKVVLVLTTIGSLITFGKYLVVGVEKLYTFALTERGKAALLVGIFGVCLLVLGVVVLRG